MHSNSYENEFNLRAFILILNRTLLAENSFRRINTPEHTTPNGETSVSVTCRNVRLEKIERLPFNRLRLIRCAMTQKSEETGCIQLTLYKYLTAALRNVSSSVVMGTGKVLASLNSGVLLFCTISVSWSAKSKKRYTTYGLGCIPEEKKTNKTNKTNKTIADISRAVYVEKEWS